MLFHLLVAASAGLAAGLLIGCVGVGGVILVPVLVEFGGLSVHAAIAVAMAGFIVTGLVGVALFLRRGSLRLDRGLPLLLCAMPGAVAGSLAAHEAPGWLLQLAIAVLAAASGLQILIRNDDGSSAGDRSRIAGLGGGLVGLASGFLSALTGTGGPVVLLPILLWLGMPVLTALGLAQASQLPIALLATVSNAGVGSIDWRLSLLLGLGLAAGAWLGGRLAHDLDRETLRRSVAIVLVAVGVLLLARSGWRIV